MEDEASVACTGTPFILLSTHVGEEQYIRQEMYDTKAISNVIDHLEFFVTVMWNPN